LIRTHPKIDPRAPPGRADFSCARAEASRQPSPALRPPGDFGQNSTSETHVEDRSMDYGKTGTAKKGGGPKRSHQEHNSKGTEKNPYGAKPADPALVARLKAAAEARKTD
jgi:hypothetical protein